MYVIVGTCVGSLLFWSQKLSRYDGATVSRLIPKNNFKLKIIREHSRGGELMGKNTFKNNQCVYVIRTSRVQSADNIQLYAGIIIKTNFFQHNVNNIF